LDNNERHHEPDALTSGEKKFGNKRVGKSTLMKIWGVLFNVFKVFLGIILLVFILLQIPKVQSFIAQKVAINLSKKLGFDISIEGVQVQWFDEAKLFTVQVEDREGASMIDADVLKLDFSIFSLMKSGDIYLDDAIISNTQVHLIKRDSLNFTQFVKAINALAKPKDTTVVKKAPYFHIENAILDNVRFSYHSAFADSMEAKMFDFNHFNIENISAVLDKFRVAKDTIEFELRNLQGREMGSSLKIKRFKTNFLFCNTKIVMDNLDFKFNNSVIKDYLTFKYSSTAAFSDFVHKVNISAHLDSSVIYTEDLTAFAPTLEIYKDKYLLSADLKGTVSNLFLKNATVYFGKNSHVRGKMAFIGFPNIPSTLMDLKLKKSKVNGNDLVKYVPNTEEILPLFGNVNFNADFYGLTSDFVTKGTFQSDLGWFETDLNLKTEEEIYSGKFETNNFNLGKLIGDTTTIQKVSMSGHVKGKGFSIDKADFNLDAQSSQFGFKGYDYKNIVVDGNFQKELFVGDIAIADENLKLIVEGEVNFRDSSFNFIAKLDTVSFQKTGLMPKSGYAKTFLEANFKGLDSETITGEILLNNTEILYDNTDLSVDFFDIVSTSFGTNSRKLTVESDMLDLVAEGEFSYNQVVQDAERFIKELELGVSGNDSLKSAYFISEAYEEVKNTEPYSMIFDVEAKEINKLIRLFNKELYVSPGARINGEIAVGEVNKLVLNAHSDTIYYRKNETYRDSLKLNISRKADSIDFELDLLLTSGVQDWNGFATESLYLSAKNENGGFTFTNEITHSQSGDEVHVEGDVILKENTVVVDLADTKFQFFNEYWQNTGRSVVEIQRDLSTIHFDNFQFTNKKQKVRIDGNLSKNPEDSLHVLVKDVKLSVLEPYIGFPLSGRANVDAQVADVFNNFKLESDIKIDSIFFAGYELGTLTGSSNWNNEKQRLNIKSTLNRKGFDILNLGGKYLPSEENPKKKINLTANLNGLSLKVLEPLFAGIFNGIEGTAIGLLRIKGSPSALDVRGSAYIYNGMMNLKVLNSPFYFKDVIRFEEGFIGMKNLEMRDKNGNKGVINGGIYHVGFKNFVFQMEGKLDKFMVFDLPYSKDALYYGTAIGSGSVSIFGPPAGLDISVNAKTEKGTKIYIPLDGSASVAETTSFIKFVNPKDSVNREEQEVVNTSGIKMDLNIEITPDAYAEIIFDRKAGDIIRGSGQGKLKMLIDLQGDFTMFGDVEILDGAYNFTLLNVVNKEFGVLSNSHITWSGDPLDAKMDITATYTQKASFAPILQSLGDSSLLAAPEIRRGYPVQVLLNLFGPMMSPAITFDVKFKEYPTTVLVQGVPISLESYIAQFQQRLKRDEQELNRQVFSLIVLKRLSPENTFSGMGQSAGSSVSELLSNQLSYWVSQVDENLEIDFDINGLDSESLNTFQLRLSYTFLDGRLRVSREGGFTNTQNETDPSSLVGNWTIEYLLTRDGKLRMKMYTRQNVNSLSLQQGSTTTGASLLRTVTFNSFKDLIPGFLKDREEERRRKRERHKRIERIKAKKEKVEKPLLEERKE
jgi:hypothetical protein